MTAPGTWPTNPRYRFRRGATADATVTSAVTSTAAVDTALRLAMRIGDALLLAGMSASDVVALMLRIARAYGLSRVHVDVTYTSISLSYHPGPSVPPLTYIRTVRHDVVDYTKVRALNKLVERIEAGLPVDRAVVVCERVITAPPPYPWWVRTIANAAVGSAVSLLFTTSWTVLVTTFGVGCVIDRVLAAFDRRRVPPFFQQFAAAGLITLIAAALTYAGAHGVGRFAELEPTLIVVGGIIMLVAGMMIVGAVQDAIDQFYITASARVFEVVMRTGGIVVGIVTGLRLAQRMGAELAISSAPLAFGALPAQIVGATLVAALFALRAYADLSTILLSAGMGLLGWLMYASLLAAGASDVVAHAFGALVAALVATLAVGPTSIPAFGVVSAAVLPLVPGLLLYNGLLQVVGTVPGAGDLTAGLSTLVLAFEVALSVAAGVSLGTFLARPVVERLRRAARA